METEIVEMNEKEADKEIEHESKGNDSTGKHLTVCKCRNDTKFM